MRNGTLFYRARDLCGTAGSRRNGEEHMLPMSPATLWRMVREGAFPEPVRLSRGVTAWRADLVDAWIKSRGAT